MNLCLLLVEEQDQTVLAELRQDPKSVSYLLHADVVLEGLISEWVAIDQGNMG